MKKIVLWGDDIFTGPQGFAELLADRFFLQNPRLEIQTYSYGGEGTSIAQVGQQTPLHVISKSPEYILLAIGYADLQAGKLASALSIELLNTLHLMLEKTKAEVYFANLCVDLLPESLQEQAKEFNQFIANLTLPRLNIVDLNQVFHAFLEAHRESAGEKRSLHTHWNKLTPLGKMLLADAFFHRLPAL